MILQADEIYGGLWQGAVPPTGHFLHNQGFDTLVLCAEEVQYDARLFPGIRVIHAPNRDDPLVPISRQRLRIALNAAKRVAQAVQDNKQVLVTCFAGRNRSGLVSGLALHLLFGWSGARCIQHVQERRSGALTNPQFTNVLSNLRAESHAS